MNKKWESGFIFFSQQLCLHAHTQISFLIEITSNHLLIVGAFSQPAYVCVWSVQSPFVNLGSHSVTSQLINISDVN